MLVAVYEANTHIIRWQYQLVFGYLPLGLLPTSLPPPCACLHTMLAPSAHSTDDDVSPGASGSTLHFCRPNDYLDRSSVPRAFASTFCDQNHLPPIVAEMVLDHAGTVLPLTQHTVPTCPSLMGPRPQLLSSAHQTSPNPTTPVLTASRRASTCVFPTTLHGTVTHTPLTPSAPYAF